MKKAIFTFSVIIFVLIAQSNVLAQCCNFAHHQQVEPLTSAATFGVALADFDNDGDSDAVAISAYYGIDVYFNNGNGTFTLNTQYAVGSNFYGVNVADVDADGDPDIIAIPFYTGDNLTILKNNGSGTFVVSSFSTNIATYYGAIGDIDSDGDIDVFLPNSGGGSGKVMKNNGTGSYTLFQTLAGARGHDAALADLDGDGDLDAFVVENSSYGNSVFLNDGTGFFTQLGTTFSSNGSHVALGDLDGDGDKDAWVGTFGSTAEIWLNNDSGVFTMGTTINTGSYCKAVNLYDKDGDGDLDVYTGFYSSSPQVWTNNGNLSFTQCYNAPVGSSSHGMAIGDINTDGLMDMYSGYFSNDEGDWVFLDSGAVVATIVYESSMFCNNAATQNVMHTGATGGIYSANPAGLSINATTGAITPGTSTPGNYTVTYTVSGCPFSTSIGITSIDATTSLAGITITANQAGAAYQWVDCNNGNQLIAGQTAQSYTPASNGSYAVIVTYTGCKDTSACVNITTVGIAENMVKDNLVVSPNPASDQISVQVNASLLGSLYAITDATGRIVLSGKILEKHSIINIADLPAGLYLLKVAGQNLQTLKVIKK